MPAPHSPPTHLPARDPAGHKGTFGTVAVIGGCCDSGRRMIGAPALAAEAALRSGAGLARVAAPMPLLNAVLLACPSATGDAIPVGPDRAILAHEAAAVVDRLASACNCLVVGPGMGASEGARAAALRCVQQEAVPVVVDADAVNNLAGVPELARDFRAAAILTPHPGEFRRLGGVLGIRLDPADPALATAGTGDVLSGVIAGIAAQRGPASPMTLLDAACLAVRAHAAAADLWVAAHGARAGMLAGELAALIPRAVEGLRP